MWRDGKIAGVVVVKLNLEWFQAPMRRSRSSSRTITASCSCRRCPHGSTTRCALSRVDLRDAPVRVSAAARALRAAVPREQAPDRRSDWLLVTLAPIAPVDADARNATIVTGFGFVSVALLAFYWRMRARVREMIRGRALLQQAYAELNRRVEERTADLSEANEQLQKEVGDRIRAEQELRAAHDELIQASKLAALGQMAAGITHERTSRSRRCAARTTRACCSIVASRRRARELEAIAALTERMGKITNQLKLFVGRAKPRNEQALVVRALRSVLSLLDERLRGVALTLTLQDATVSPAQDAPLDLARDYPGSSPVARICASNRC